MTTQLAPATRVSPTTKGGLRYVPLVALGTDTVLATFAVMVATLGQQHGPAASAAASDRISTAGPAMILGWVALLVLFGAYRLDIFGAGVDELKRVANASLALGAIVGVTSYAVRFDLPRTFFLIAFGLGLPLLMAGRLLVRRALQRARSRGILQARVVIAGSEGHVDEIASVLRRESWLGYDVVGALTPAHGDRASTHSGIPVLGHTRSVGQVALDVEADVIFLAGGAFDSAEHVRQLAWDLEHEAVQIVIAPSVTDAVGDHVSMRPVGGLPLIHLEQPLSQSVTRVAKRAFDLVGATALLVLTLPILALAAWRVRREDGSPVLQTEVRVGRGGRAFTARTLRTERHGLDAAEVSPLFEDPDDERRTETSRWMRRFAVDELPLLVNVLKGDMSLVGPRAPMPHEVSDLRDQPRLRVRPGLTGMWRDFRRSDLSWSETVLLDVHYADHWSVLQDVSILVRTVGTVFSGDRTPTR